MYVCIQTIGIEIQIFSGRRVPLLYRPAPIFSSDELAFPHRCLYGGDTHTAIAAPACLYTHTQKTVTHCDAGPPTSPHSTAADPIHSGARFKIKDVLI